MTRKEVLRFVKRVFHTEADYPFDEDTAVLRHRTSRKWYGIIIRVRKERVGLPGEGEAELLNLKGDPLLISSLKETEGYLPAYHMNKEKWISVRLDGSAEKESVKSLIRMSYDLSMAKEDREEEALRQKYKL